MSITMPSAYIDVGKSLSELDAAVRKHFHLGIQLVFIGTTLRLFVYLIKERGQSRNLVISGRLRASGPTPVSSSGAIQPSCWRFLSNGTRFCHNRGFRGKSSRPSGPAPHRQRSHPQVRNQVSFTPSWRAWRAWREVILCLPLGGPCGPLWWNPAVVQSAIGCWEKGKAVQGRLDLARAIR